MVQAIAPNAFFVFAGTFPTNNAIANLLLASPVTFYQGLGDFTRGVRLWNVGSYAQDEWRAARSLTVNYGVRYERINPFTEIEDRLNGVRARACSRRSGRTRRRGCCSPATRAWARASRTAANAFMPRVGFAWDPTGDGRWSVRSSYGLFYDQFQNGAGHGVAGGDQRDSVRRSSTSTAAPGSTSQSLPRPRVSGPRHLRPAVDGVRDGRRRQAALHAELERRRAAVARRPLSRRSALRRRERVSGCRATSRRTRRSTGRARPRRTPIAGASTRTARPTAAPAISRPSRCCGTSPLELPFAAG